MRQHQDRARRTVLIAANSSWNLVNFRSPIIRALQERDFRVVAAVPHDRSADALAALGIAIEPVSIDASGLSPLADLRLLLQYLRIMRRVAPAAFLPFTAKPNVYGSIAALRHRIPVINTITGLGTGFLGGPGFRTVMSGLYGIALRRSRRVFFHNSDDRDLFVARRLVGEAQAVVIPGSGIDLSYFQPPSGGREDGQVNFLFVGRLLCEKGIREFAEAAEAAQARRSARFQILGGLENHPRAVSPALIEEWHRKGVVEFLGTAADVRPFIANADCVVLPSYREGLPRVLLEASAMAKPVIASDVPGCRQAVDSAVTGFLCEARSAESLLNAMIRFIDLAASEREAMGRAGRVKAEREFSKELVINAYLKELGQI